MNHTLTSLLITSVLTLPSVFGAAWPASAGGEASSTASFASTDIITISTTSSNDQLRLFSALDQNSTFNKLLTEALRVKPWELSMSADQVKNTIAKIESNATVTHDQKAILKALFPHATPEEMLLAVDKLNRNVADFDPYIHVPLLNRILHHPNATVSQKSAAAESLYCRGGIEYHSTAAAIFKAVGSDPNATRDDLKIAAHGLRRIRSELISKGLRNSGLEYYDMAATIFIRIGSDPNATIGDLLFAAHGLRLMTGQYYPTAADFYYRAALHKDRTLDVLVGAESGLVCLGTDYSAQLKEVRDILFELRSKVQVKPSQ